MKLWFPAGSLTLLAVLVLTATPPNLPNLPNLDGAPLADTVSIASLNLDHQTNFEKVVHDFEAAPRVSHADIILLQDMQIDQLKEEIVKNFNEKISST